MSNPSFETDKDREISSFGATVGSIRRRLTNPLPKRQNRLERRALQAIQRTESNSMPKKRNRQGETNGDWEASADEESYTNGASGSNREVSRDGEDNSNSYANNSTGGRSHQKRDGGPSQQKRKQDLGQWTDAVSDSVQKMGAAHKALEDLRAKFASHKEELSKLEETRAIVIQLQNECREKQEEIGRQANTITTLSKMSRQTEEKAILQTEENERERRELEKEKAKNEKRVAATIAEERRRNKAVLDKLIEDHAQSYEDKKKNLEDELNEKTDQNNKAVEALESENIQLLKTVKEQKEAIAVQAIELKKSIEQCDVLERAKDSFKMEKQEREKQLDMIKREFALNPISKDEFKRKFRLMNKMIEDISITISHGIDGKSPQDLERLSKDLVEADPCFKSVPIDDSEDSYNLRSAHAQRIISDAICEYIWKPFNSEFTLSHPEFKGFLIKIADELERYSHSGRASNVWKALTMRALQNLPADSGTSHILASSTERVSPTISGRTEAVITRVFNILSHLVNPSQGDKLRIDLVELAKCATDLWNDAQTGELKIIVIPSLDHTYREEWRSQTFDPPRDFDGTTSDNLSKTYPRIFTLFPRVVARELVDPIQHDAAPPGSWPLESIQAPRVIETCIHTGVGLPEWSSLVVRGRTAQEEKDEYISKAIENAREVVHSQRRNTGHGRRESIVSLTSPPSSPSQQWKTGGVMKITEN